MLMLANRMHLASGRMRKSLHVRLETESSRIREWYEGAAVATDEGIELNLLFADVD